MLTKRIITGIIGIIAAFFAINKGGIIFNSMIVIIGCLAWREFVKAFKNINKNLALVEGLMVLLLLFGTAWFGNSQEIIMFMLLANILIFSKIIFNAEKFKLEEAFFTIAGISYIGFAFIHFIYLAALNTSTVTVFGSELTLSSAFIWLAFLGTLASDTFAFFVGSKFGKHKLCPQISPAKTVEGFIGGIIGSTIILILLAKLFNFLLLPTAILGLIIGFIAPLGDLIESSIKRYTMIKDSGTLLPGHGGVLDRFDSAMIVIPIVYYYLQYINLY